MLFFHCAGKKELEQFRRLGLEGGGDGIELWTRFSEAQNACTGRILVIDPSYVRPLPEVSTNKLWVKNIPPEGILNLSPYLPAAPVVAAGGVIVRRGIHEPEILLIFRRGVWDLPKGKLDKEETVPGCALREVREELGIQALIVLQDLDATVHGYPDKGKYLVKTTHWFLMQTPETAFMPQSSEGIKDVAWMPWPEAVEKIGFETLRQHLIRQEGIVQAALELT